MGKHTKVRNRQFNKPISTSADSLEERLNKIETIQAKSSSSVLKFAFFFLMGVGLTILLYPEVSKMLDGMKQTKEIAAAKVAASERENVESYIEQEYNLDDDDLEDSDNPAAEEARSSNKPNASSTQYADRNDEPVKSVPLEFEKFNALEDELISNKDQSSESNRKTERDIEPDSQEVKLSPFKLNKEENLESLEDKTVSQEVKFKKVQNKNKKTVKDKQNSSIKEKKTSQSQNSKVKQELPKEVLEFKPTILKGVTPKKIFADGRRIPPMELLPQKPNNSSVKVWMFEEFLSEAECDGLIRVHNQHVAEQSKQDPILCFDSVSTLRKHLRNIGKKTHVTPRDFTPGTTCVNVTFSRQLRDWLKGNWSYSTAFYPGESRFASVFEHRVKEAMGLLPENGGKFQITSYPKGIGYKTHRDCIEDNEDQRDRVATVLVYLDTVSEGGETSFPDLGIWVRPRKARALVWNNMDAKGRCELMSRHKANKVDKGRKIILIRWYYYKSFYSLGKRPPEPHLPERKPGQPRVSCDEYENGSCRWYDEWNFEHLIEYERQKYTLV